MVTLSEIVAQEMLSLQRSELSPDCHEPDMNTADRPGSIQSPWAGLRAPVHLPLPQWGQRKKISSWSKRKERRK